MKEVYVQCLKALQECIQACEQCIDACQVFADKCSTQDKQECARQVGICKNRLHNCIEQCGNVIELSYAYMTQSNNPEHTDALNRVSIIAKQCISLCKESIKACDNDFDNCNTATLRVIHVCSECAKICAKAMHILKNT